MGLVFGVRLSMDGLVSHLIVCLPQKLLVVDVFLFVVFETPLATFLRLISLSETESATVRNFVQFIAHWQAHTVGPI